MCFSEIDSAAKNMRCKLTDKVTAYHTLTPTAQNANTKPKPPNRLAIVPTASSFVAAPRAGMLEMYSENVSGRLWLCS